MARGGLRRPPGLVASKVVPDMCLVSRLRCGLCCVACGAAAGAAGRGHDGAGGAEGRGGWRRARRGEERRTPPHKSGESASVETRRDAARKGLQTGIEPRVSKVVSLTPVPEHATGNARRTRTSSGHATHCSNIGRHSPSAYCPVTDRAGSAVSVRHIIFPAPRE